MLKYNNFLNEKLEQELISDIDKIIEDSPFENKSKEELDKEYAKMLGRKGELAKYLKEHNMTFTFGNA